MNHPFFTEVNNYPHLVMDCNLNINVLPQEYKGKNKIKAILLGADPTNNGIKNKPGLVELETVFGISTDYEKDFFNPQLINLREINISKEDLYIQNLCRNYFKDQTGKNKNWDAVGKLWVKYLKEELKQFEPDIPILATAEKILRVLTDCKSKAEEIYNHPERHLPLYSQCLLREVYPLYRHPKYYLSQQPEYLKYLSIKFK
jgi:hypothetical protein